MAPHHYVTESTGTAVPVIPLEYFLRHIDDEPGLSDCRSKAEVVDCIAQTAIGFALVGEVEGATKLLDILHQHGLDPWSGASVRPFIKACMYFAWEATSLWPGWVAEAERSEEELQKLEENSRKFWLSFFGPKWSVDESTRQKAASLAREGMLVILPACDSPGKRVSMINDMWKAGKFGNAMCPNFYLSKYIVPNLLWSTGTRPWQYGHLHVSAALTLDFDIGLRLQLEEEPMETLRKMCKRYMLEEQLEMMACSRTAWKKLYSDPDRIILGLLEMNPKKMSSAVRRSVLALEQRLRDGPRRKYKNMTVKELVHAISENTYLNCPYEEFKRMSIQERTIPRDKKGILLPAATAQNVLDLEERLGTTLPADYKEFLRVSNGMGQIWDGETLVRHLGSVENVGWAVTEQLSGLELSLLREENSCSGDNGLSWPLKFSSCRLIDISAGESDLWLVPKETLDTSRNYFFKTYSERTAEQQRELKDAVEETYGSMQRFRDLEWGVISWTEWSIIFTPYSGMRDLLEQLAEKSMRKHRPWMIVFDPSVKNNTAPWSKEQEEAEGKERGSRGGREDRVTDWQ